MGSSSVQAGAASAVRAARRSEPAVALRALLGRVRSCWRPREALRGLGSRREGADASLDGIRALSVVFVFFHHAVAQYLGLGRPIGAPTVAESSVFSATLTFQLGVDAFFVLSGLLIARQLLDEHRRTGGIRLADFYWRRAFRILPLYWVVVLLTLPAWPRPGNVVLNLLMINNLVPLPEAVLPWSWSLAVEEQFYLVFPWLLAPLLALSPGKRAAAVALAIVALTGWALSCAWRAGVSLPILAAVDPVALLETTSEPYTSSLYLRTDFRGIALLVGVWVACFEQWSPAPSMQRLRGAAGLLGLATLVALHTVPEAVGTVGTSSQLLASTFYVGRHVSYALAIAGIMLALRGRGAIARALEPFLASRALSAMAKLTFAFYLVHPILLQLALDCFRGQRFRWSILALCCAISMVSSLVVSAGLYALVEKPFLALRDVFLGRRGA
jgi:peptidoglycan/LPS O-acetylase OafA/YrhL